MAEPLKLTAGTMSPAPDAQERARRVEALKATVELYLPDFARTARQEEFVEVYQDDFARNYDVDEYTLLGMAVKYAGLYGRDISVTWTYEDIDGEAGP